MKIILIRHAESTANADQILAGRLPGIELTENGLKQAESLISLFSTGLFAAIYSSPIQRCLQTAQITLDSQSLDIIENDFFLEVDYGSWSGEKISTLANDPLWSIVQKQPSNAKFPDGESLLNMSQRANKGFESIIKSHKSTDVIAIFSHADIIKAIISHQIGNDFNNYQKLMIDNAKVNILHFKESEMALAGMNLPVSDFTLSLIGKE